MVLIERLRSVGVRPGEPGERDYLPELMAPDRFRVAAEGAEPDAGPAVSVTTLLKAIGLTNEDILREFFLFDSFHLGKNGATMDLVAERLRGEMARFDITGKDGKAQSIANPLFTCSVCPVT